ncbi:MAG TPA: transporter substrate-binding domain-containing protein [Campylobacterales bacterium]|nr:transporter substrate-binding domain-containing protein [Campylobacterales bacterium]
MKLLLQTIIILFSLGLNFIYAMPLENKVLKNTKKININLTNKEKDFLKKHPVITVHNELDYPPYNFNENGKPKGFSIDYLNLLAKKLGIQVKYISGYTWAEFMDMARNNKIDVMLNIMRTPEREKFLHFTQPYAGTKKAIFTNDSKVQTLRDLEGKTVSVIKGYFMQHFLEAYHPDIHLKLEKNARDCIASVKNGNSDATVGSSGIMRYLMKQNKLYLAYGHLINDRRLSLDLNIAISPALPMLRDILQKAMYSVSNSELRALKEKWIGAGTLKIPVSGTLTKKELEYLHKNNVVKMCIDPDWEPIEFADRADGYITKGISTDTMKCIGENLNITFKAVPTKNWSESQRYLQEKKCDILPTAVKTKKREMYAQFTYPYLDYKLAIITKEDQGFVSSLMDVIDKPIARKKGSALITKLQSLYPAVNIVEAKDALESFKMVDDGRAYATISTLPVASHYINKYDLKSIGIAGYTDMRLRLSIAVRKDNPLLLSILDKALATIPQAQHKLIYDRWVGRQVTQPFNYLYLFYASIAFLVIVLLGLYRQYILKEANRGLASAIKSKTEENLKQQQLLQEQSKLAAMGEMIGAIAHQWRQPLNALGLSIQNLEYDFNDGQVDESFIKRYVKKNKETIEFMSQTIDDFRNFFKVDKIKEAFSAQKAIDETVSIQEASLKKHNISLKITAHDFSIYGFRSEFQQVILNIITNAAYELKHNKIQNPKIDIVLKDEIITISDNALGIDKTILDRIFEPYFTTKEQGEGTGIGLYMSKVIIEENMGGSLTAVNTKEGGASFIIDFRKAI